MSRVAIDPVSRVGGHLRLEVEIANGVVSDAWSSGTMFRGVELILEGRDPRDAWLFAQRVCGACTGVHALASVRAVESALGLAIPRNARLIRNLLAGTQYVTDHVAGFYHVNALDWVDLSSALTADPAATSSLAQSQGAWEPSSTLYFKLIKEKLAAPVQSGQLGPFANGYWGHPAYALSPEQNLLILTHYLQALDWQRRVHRIRALLGGKDPHPQTYLVGGMALAPEWGGPLRALPGEHPRQVDRDAPTALSARGLAIIGEVITAARTFVDQVYVPDVMLVASRYPEWARIGKGIGHYLSYGEFPEDDATGPALLLPRGRIMDGNLAAVLPVEQAGVAEDVTHGHYVNDGGPALRHPWSGRTEPRYAGPRPPVTTLEGSDKYSWLKAPRYQGQPMEVGPLARMLVAYAQGQPDVKAGLDGAVGRLAIGQAGLFSTIGRLVARAVETQIVAGRLDGWKSELAASLASGDLAVADITRWEPEAWPGEVQGVSLGEGPRGAVGHWVTIRNRKVGAYQVVDASTWNGSPRDAQGRRGAWEQALIGTPVADPARPVEILRTLHSFDPCLACAVHVHRPQGGSRIDLRVVQEAGR